MNPTEIKQILSQIGGGANKQLGQHFLIDKAALTSIIEAADVKKGDRVLEVGPGLGVLTRALVNAGAEVIAIERDRRFVEYLVGAHAMRPDRHVGPSEGVRGSTELAEVHTPVRLIQADAAKIDWDGIVGDEPWKFVSNLPYSITSLALRKALWSKNPPQNVVVLVQREVAERAIALSSPLRRGSKRGSLLSLMLALASSSAKIVRHVPAGAFYPPPKVESAILQITPMTQTERLHKWRIDPEAIMKIAKQGFAHPRKLLRSNLQLPAARYSLLANQKARAEELSPEDWARLAMKLAEK